MIYDLPFRHAIVAGRNGAGACSAPGFKLGDQIAIVTNLTDQTVGESLFERAISVDDQIQQISLLNLTGKKFDVVAIAFNRA